MPTYLPTYCLPIIGGCLKVFMYFLPYVRFRDSARSLGVSRFSLSDITYYLPFTLSPIYSSHCVHCVVVHII